MPTLKVLADRQNPDGGWGYHRGGSSWTEPTSYALLALAADGLAGEGGVRRGLSWLASQQRAEVGTMDRPGPLAMTRTPTRRPQASPCWRCTALKLLGWREPWPPPSATWR